MNRTTFVADAGSLEILRAGTIEGNVFKLPNFKLERAQYEAVNSILTALGAKWDRKAHSHVFDYDIKDELRRVLDTGIVTDWKKSTDFFFTPEPVVNEMLGLVQKPLTGRFKVLEPEAGQGHILDVTKENFPNAEFLEVEMNPMHCQRLREKGYSPVNDDFLNVTPTPVDIVLMNPPFSNQWEHIRHAFEFVKPGGQLISVAAGNILAPTRVKKATESQQWFDSVRGTNYPLPQNSFKESGTNVSTTLLTIWKN